MLSRHLAVYRYVYLGAFLMTAAIIIIKLSGFGA
jgi:hypothetical protein